MCVANTTYTMWTVVIRKNDATYNMAYNFFLYPYKPLCKLRLSVCNKVMRCIWCVKKNYGHFEKYQYIGPYQFFYTAPFSYVRKRMSQVQWLCHGMGQLHKLSKLHFSKHHSGFSNQQNYSLFITTLCSQVNKIYLTLKPFSF